jgi:PIN domain nuclease of toxin-antitoxin system
MRHEMRRLLIDTQVVIWWLEGTTKLAIAARHALEES